jgi:hypothetical protein
MPGEGPTSTPFPSPALQDVDTGPSPGMTWRGTRVTPNDLVISQRLLSSDLRGDKRSNTFAPLPERHGGPAGRAEGSPEDRLRPAIHVFSETSTARRG